MAKKSKTKVNIDTLDFTQTISYMRCMYLFTEIDRRTQSIKRESLKILSEMDSKPSKREIKKSIEKQIDKVFEEIEPQVYEKIGEALEEMLEHNEGATIEYYAEIKRTKQKFKDGKLVETPYKEKIKVKIEEELDKRKDLVNEQLKEKINEMRKTLKNGTVEQINRVLNTELSQELESLKNEDK